MLTFCVFPVQKLMLFGRVLAWNILKFCFPPADKFHFHPFFLSSLYFSAVVSLAAGTGKAQFTLISYLMQSYL